MLKTPLLARLFIAPLLLLAVGCSGGATPPAPASSPTGAMTPAHAASSSTTPDPATVTTEAAVSHRSVLAVETFLADVAQNVAGSRLKVNALMPIGVDPHSFEPTPEDIARIAGSDVVIVNGADLEESLEELLTGGVGQQHIVVASAGLTSREKRGEDAHVEQTGDAQHHHASDPHFWLDPNNVMEYVENIRDGFSRIDPKGSAVYAANADAYNARLRDLDRWIVEQVKQIPSENRLLVTNHDSLGYFADRYGFKVVGTILPSVGTGASPSAQQMARLVDHIRSARAKAIFLETGASPQLAEQVAKDVRERVSILAMTPAMYWMLLHKTPIREARLDSIRILTYGGAPMPPDLLLELRQAFPGVKCFNGYGSTEASVISILEDEFCESRPTSVGLPALCSEVKIVDPSGRELGPGSAGELAVRGALVSRGYYRLPEETAAVYREGWFYSGDAACRDAEGFIYLLGRTREMINRGGENVYPVEVENVLHLHPKILDVAVFGVPDPVMGERVGCAVILRPGADAVDPEEIQEFCRKELADYKVPRDLFFVNELPRNPGGKVMKKKLREELLKNLE